MEQSVFLKALAQQKKMYQLLNDVMDISRQLAECADRNDPVSVQMFVALREDPIGQLRVVRRALDQQIDEAERSGAEGERLVAILNGGEGRTPEEQALAAQVGTNMRLHKRVIELDKAISMKLAHEKSFYANK